METDYYSLKIVLYKICTVFQYQTCIVPLQMQLNRHKNDRYLLYHSLLL